MSERGRAERQGVHPRSPGRARVLFIDSGQGAGGSSAVLRYLLPRLDRAAFEPMVAFYAANDGLDTCALKDAAIPVFFLSTRRRPGRQGDGLPARRVSAIRAGWRTVGRFVAEQSAQLIRLIALIQRERPAVIVLNNDVHYHLVGALAARITATPCICRKAGGIGKGRRIKRMLTPWIDLFVAISTATARDQTERNPETRRLVMLPTGIDLTRFHPRPRDPAVLLAMAIPADAPIAVNIGRFDAGKGQREFLEAAALVAERRPEARFLVVGDEVGGTGEMLAELRALAVRLGIADRTRFAGWRADVEVLLSAIDVLVHVPTTWIEGLPVCVLEAMAMGKPVVASDNGGIPDAVRDGETGFLVPVGDVAATAERVCRILDNAEMAERLGRAARRCVEQQFDVERNARQFETLLREIAAAPRTRRRASRFWLC